MQRIATLSPPPAIVFNRAARLRAWLQRTWQQLTLDDDERYIRGATDLADLEYRLKKVGRGRIQRFGPLDPGA